VTALVAVLATLLTTAGGVLVGLAVAAARRDLMRRADEQVDLATRDRLVASLYLERVVVTLHSGEGFTGLLADQDAESLLLRSAQALPAGRDVDGELLIPRRDVHYLQKP
jgi:hypothetical protein